VLPLFRELLVVADVLNILYLILQIQHFKIFRSEKLAKLQWLQDPDQINPLKTKLICFI
jgi:hypothetical protein